MERTEPRADSRASWTRRRQRAEELRERYPFAAAMLTLYEALLEVQARAFDVAHDELPAPAAVPGYVAQNVLPHVIDATIVHGPDKLAADVRELCREGEFEEIVARWLAGEEQPASQRYLARAATAPILEALDGMAGLACQGPQQERSCPVCGGLPQLAYFSASGESLVTAPRKLMCGRCANTWIIPRTMCAACGEQSTSKLPIFGEKEQFPQVRVAGCESCRRYLLTIDLRQDARAVPDVDELAALPLDLYAQERGFSKILPNLMGN